MDTHRFFSLFIAVDFLILTISFFTLMVKLMPKIWLDEIAKFSASVLLSAAILRYFSA